MNTRNDSMLWRAMVFSGVCLAAFATLANAGIVPVYNTNDALAGSLRQAIQDAAPGDTIVFHIPASDPGYDPVTNTFNITLTSASLSIAKNLMIDAGTTRIVIKRPSGSSSAGIFQVMAGTVSISNLTMSQSSASGLVSSGGTAIIRNCLFRDNRGAGTDAGGIYILSGGTVHVVNCTFFGNTGGVAGTIGNGGTLSLSNSTLVGTSAAAPVISSFGTTRVRNNIIVGNGSAATGNFISEGYNLVGNISGSSGFGVTGDQTGATVGQANLELLQDNGGPTMTMRPMSPSPAIDQGFRGLDNQSQPINTDQRGQPRPVDLAPPNAVGGDGSDIGAVELGAAQSGPTFTVTNIHAGNDGSCSTDDCTFVEALLAANANADASTITFASGVTGAISIFPFTISNPLTITGPGARLLTISADTITGGRIFQVTSSNVVITGLTLINGIVFNTNGGAIHNLGGLTMRDCTIAASSANGNDPVGFGGAIYNGAGANLNLTRCTIRNCTATSYGGGVYSDGNVTATNCTFTGNSGLRGGGIISRAVGGAAIMTLLNCTFTNNTATDGVNSPGFGGGGIYAEGSAPQHFMANCVVAGNISTNDRDIRGNYTSQGHNLIGRVGDSAGLVNGSNGDIVGDNTTGINAQFGSFGNNGGQTDTWSLLSNSPARDAGNDANAPTRDQRGYSRSGVSDIGAFEFNGTPPPLVPVVSVVSNKLHGAQTFGINLPLTGSPGIECRSGGANGDFTVVFTFSNTLTNVGGVNVTSGAATIATGTGINPSDAHQYAIQLTAVVNAQVVTLQLTNVNDSLGNNTPVLQVPIGVLLGDTTGSGSVNATDVSQVRLQSGQLTSSSNFRTDVTVSGTVNATDVSTVRLKSGTALPP